MIWLRIHTWCITVSAVSVARHSWADGLYRAAIHRAVKSRLGLPDLISLQQKPKIKDQVLMSKAQNMPWDHMIRTSVNYGSVLQKSGQNIPNNKTRNVCINVTLRNSLNNQCSHGKEISITYSGCVSVALVIQYAGHICFIVICDCPALIYLCTLSYKCHCFHF